LITRIIFLQNNAVQRNIERWEEAIEDDSPTGGIPVVDGEINENKVSNVKLSGEEAFKIEYFTFDSHRIAYYVSSN